MSSMLVGFTLPVSEDGRGSESDGSVFSDREWIEENNSKPHWVVVIFFLGLLFLIPLFVKWIFS